jgi:hypothetical protein
MYTMFHHLHFNHLLLKHCPLLHTFSFLLVKLISLLGIKLLPCYFMQIIGHILDLLEPINSSHPDSVPIPMPILPPSPTQDNLADLMCWWDTDNTAQHILTAHIGSIPRGLLPSPNLVTRTALSIYQTLTQYYGYLSFVL